MEKKEIIRNVLFFVGIILLTFLVCFISFRNEKKEEKALFAENEKIKNELIDSNKVTELPFISDTYYSFYSLNLQDLKNKPLLLKARINDIFEKEGKYFIKVSDYYPDYFAILECEKNQIDFIMQDTEGGKILKHYFIIAILEEISKPSLEVVSIEHETAKLDLERSNSFFLKGRSINIRKTAN